MKPLKRPVEVDIVSDFPFSLPSTMLFLFLGQLICYTCIIPLEPPYLQRLVPIGFTDLLVVLLWLFVREMSLRRFWRLYGIWKVFHLLQKAAEGRHEPYDEERGILAAVRGVNEQKGRVVFVVKKGPLTFA